jgi:hypothetical protein
MSPSSTAFLSAATRTMKNSSRFALAMMANFSWSSSGVVGSIASSSTRWLNSSQLSSRFRNSSGSVFGARFAFAAVTATGAPGSPGR